MFKTDYRNSVFYEMFVFLLLVDLKIGPNVNQWRKQFYYAVCSRKPDYQPYLRKPRLVIKSR